MKIRTASLLALSVLASLAAPALANVDVEIDAKAKVKGTLQPEGEVETLRFTATRGATFALVVAAKKKAPLDFDVELRAPDDSVVDLSGAPKFVDTGPKVTVKKLVLPQTGEYRLIVRATGEGEYAAKVAVVPAKKTTLVETFAADEQRVVNLAIPAGSKVTLSAKPGAGAAAPRMDSLGATDLSAAGSLGDTSHSVKKLQVAAGGELPLTITNRAAAAGDVTVSVKVIAPKVKTLKLDIRGDKLGKVAGGETAVSRTIEASVGGLVQILDPLSDISGVAVNIPGGALPDSTRITIASSPNPLLPDASRQGAGPAVFMGPEGTQFASVATITLRFDPDSLPIGVDPLTELRVIRIKADGTTETITPTSVDLVAGTMQLPTSGFSTFQPIIPVGLPNLAGKDYWSLTICFGFQADFQRMMGDSRLRYIDGDLGRASFGEIGVPDAVTRTFAIRDKTLDHDDLGNGTVTTFDEIEFVFGTWDYEGPVVVITEEEETETDVDRYVPTADGTFLVTEPNFDPGDDETYLGAMLQAHQGPLTLSQIAGDFSVGFFSINADEAPSGPALLGAERAFGTLTIRANGSASVRFDAKFSEFDGVGVSTQRDTIREDGLVTIIDDSQDPFFGAVQLTFGEDGPGLLLLPGQDMGAFLGGTAGQDNSSLFLVGVREQPGFSRATAEGFYLTGGMDVELTTYDLNGTTVPDFFACTVAGEAFYEGGSSLGVLDIGERCVFRDTNVIPDGVFVNVDLAEEAEAIPISIGRNGTFVVRGEESDRGAFGPGAGFGFVLMDPAENTEELFGMTFLIRPPEFGPPELIDR